MYSLKSSRDAKNFENILLERSLERGQVIFTFYYSQTDPVVALNSFGASVAHRFDGHVLNNKNQFSENYYERQTKIAKKFNRYFDTFGRSIVMVALSKFCSN